MMDTVIVGKIIKRLRENRNLSLDTLSVLAKVDRIHLGKIEIGLRNPTVTVLFRLADALEMKTSELIREIEEEN
jgi:transcriptional regulator with XRE-family HTH domain